MNLDLDSTEQSTLTYGKKLSTYGKFIIMEVLIHYFENVELPEQLNDQLSIQSIIDEDREKYNYEKFKFAIEKIFKHSDMTKIDEIWNGFIEDLGQSTPEKVISFVFDIYKPNKSSLLYKTFQTFGKIKQFERKDEWFSNYHINGICNGMNNLVWQDRDREKTYGLRRNPEPINESIDLIDYSRYVNVIVGELRKFIISNNFYQTNEIYEIVKPIGKLSPKEICDRCYLNYPFYYGGAHGCDFYKYPFSLNLREIKLFMQRYPSVYIGYVINTAPYISRSGQHWLSITFHKNNAYVVDSGGKNLTNFKDYGEFKSLLTLFGYGINYNPTKIQTDKYSCGMFSILSLYLMACFDCDISKTVKYIGMDGTSLINGKNIYSFTQILACSKIY